VRPWGLRLPRWLVIVPALTGSVYAAAHALAGYVTKLMHLLGIIDLDFRGWDHLDEGELIAWDLLFYEPWFLGLGVLATLGALHHYRRTGGSRCGAYRLLWITAAATIALSGYSSVLMSVGGNSRPPRAMWRAPMSRSAELHRQSTMNIAITGATGVIGRHAVEQLINAGHRVSGIARSALGERALQALGAHPVRADVFDEAALRSAFADAHAVVNLLTHIPSADRMAAPGAWDENDRLRSEASAAIARAARAVGAGRLVQESLAFVYAEGRDSWLDEAAAVAGGGTTTTALAAETNARELFAGDTVVLRFGLFIGPDSDLTRADIDGARYRGVSPSIGRRDAYRPTVWIDDAAAAVADALNAPPGTYNVVDADPPMRGEIDAALAEVVGRSGLRPPLQEIPPALEPVARSQRVSSLRLREATGWKPRVRGGTEGWRLIVAEGVAA
jgi:nucleoside-diphosphate-sugar epimerase